MAFQRAKWHSNLTYRQTCRTCKTTVEYKDDVLDFRPWYADGFVYCPKCRTPLRHSETYAKKNVQEVNNINADSSKASFCPFCGKCFGENDVFCGFCGRKR